MIGLRFILLIAGWVVASGAGGSGGNGDWTSLARKLSGTSETVRRQAIAELRQIPDLNGLMQKELGTSRRYLAVDVIAALTLTPLLPELMVRSREDEDGAIYHAINSLIDDKNAEKIGNLYLERLGSRQPVPILVVLLDTLGRLEKEIPTERLKPLLKDASHDVRSAALYYVRGRLLETHNLAYLPWLKGALTDNPYQLRLQALYALVDLRKEGVVVPGDFFGPCLNDKNAEVKKLCEKLVQNRS